MDYKSKVQLLSPKMMITIEDDDSEIQPIMKQQFELL
jgi:hypothetical protein